MLLNSGTKTTLLPFICLINALIFYSKHLTCALLICEYSSCVKPADISLQRFSAPTWSFYYYYFLLHGLIPHGGI